MDILTRIIERKREEVREALLASARDDWESRARELPPPPSFAAALRQPGRMRVIAEIKRASPSAGVLREDFRPADIAQSYATHGADAISVLTDEKFFSGSLNDLRTVARSVSVPLLRKDFVIDPVQVLEAKLAGASAVLLIAECLTESELQELVRLILSHQMTPLVELHDVDNLDKVLASGAEVIGINNRDLRTFQTDIGHTLRVARDIPAGKVIVSESGIKTPDDVKRLEDAGIHSILVGEIFMRASDPGVKLAELIGMAR